MTSKEGARVLEHLRREQANAVGLYLQYKGYHWNVSGPLFSELHALFDSHAKAVFDTIDPLAERQRMLGAPAAYTLEETRRAMTIPSDADVPSTPRGMVEALRDAHRTVIDGLKRGFAAAETAQDPGTADLFTRTVQEHEKMEWFLRELLEGRAPLLTDTQLVSSVASGRGQAEWPAQHVVPTIH